jgi:antitoxin (DNA-binding transcriptional repressor) of toxin-antitoxin stability system
MSTKTIDVRQEQPRLAELLSLVGAGVEVLLTDGITPLARMVPLAAPVAPRVAGLHAGLVATSDDFDEPLPEGFWIGAE